MQIREAHASDVPALSALATKTWLDAFGHRYTEEDRKARIEKWRSKNYFKEVLTRNTILLAEEDGAFIGYLEFGPPDIPIATNAGDQEITRLYILAGHQRKGIGTQLLEAALVRPEMQKASAIYLDVWEENKDAIRLYERFGFVSTGTDVDGDLIMVKK